MVPIALEILFINAKSCCFWGILGELMLSEALVIYAVGVPISMFYVKINHLFKSSRI